MSAYSSVIAAVNAVAAGAIEGFPPSQPTSRFLRNQYSGSIMLTDCLGILCQNLVMRWSPRRGDLSSLTHRYTTPVDDMPSWISRVDRRQVLLSGR